ncbi:MAG: phosphoesterase [Acidobacteria bacterium]|nr:phosphoesterase [Acidobacteriota bacterium]
MAKKVRICFHDRCFDGTASAAVFSRFYRECVDPQAQFHYSGLIHRPAGTQLDEGIFDGDENVIVDFKYSPSARLTWWFDHHQSAFLTPADADHFRRDRSGRKFYDPGYKSCTKFLATVAREKFKFRPEPLEELIRWADIIDGAQYESPEAAVRMNVPATQIALVIEASNDDQLTSRLIPALAGQPLGEVARLPTVAEHFQELYRRHQNSIEVLREKAEYDRGVVYFDLSDYPLEGYNKFIPYYLYPDCVYSVGISRTSQRLKVAVGSNPWKQPEKEKNLASLCERYGGGGHARVAAISFDASEFERARRAGREIAEELRR